MLEKEGETARDRTATTTRKGPLAGLRIIEIGQMLAGPFVGSRLADFGAEVIKVEAPDRTDPMRVWGKNKYKDKYKHSISTVQVPVSYTHLTLPTKA